MNLKHISMAFLAAGALLAACQEEQPTLPEMTVDKTEATFEQGEGSTTVQITATRDWYVSTPPQWIAVNPDKGSASLTPQTVTISVNANADHDRTGEVVFVLGSGLEKHRVAITQPGALGKLSKGTGTLDDPFTVAGACEAVSSLTWTSTSEYEKIGPYYVKGKVCTITQDYTYNVTTTNYGNARFAISDDGLTTGDVFTLYNLLYFGGNKFQAGQTDIQLGDDVVIYAPLMNYRGNTPENTGGYLYSINGATGSEVTPVEPGEVEQISCAEFISRADQNTTYRLVGEVTSDVNTTYCSFDMNDGTATVVVWTVNNKDEWKSVVKKGGTVTVRGKYQPYTDKSGNLKHEMVDAYIEAFSPAGDTPVDPTGVEQISCAEFISRADQNTTYRLVGEVTSDVNTTYCSFDMNDGTATVVVWTVNNKDEWSSVVKKGGTVTVRGKYQPYTDKSGNLKHEMVDAYIEAFTAGDTPVNTGTPSGDGTLDNPFNPAGAVAYIDGASYSSDARVYVKGIICSIKNTFDVAHGTAIFTISEDGSTSSTQFTCYSIYYLENKSWQEGCTQIKVGDEVVAYGKVTLYGGTTYETVSKDAYIYSLNGKTEAEAGDDNGGGNGGGDQTGGDFTSNVSWTSGSDGAYDQKADVNGTADVSILKLGAGSKFGKSVLSSEAAFQKLTFYAVSWKGVTEAVLVFSIDGQQVATASPKANNGLVGNPTYTISVTDSDLYTVDLGTSVTEVTVETTVGYRAALFGIKAE